MRTLLEAGVAHVFTLYGGHLEAIFQACREHRLALTDVRHEVAAGHAAEGYARAKRTLGVCLVTAGPGFTNVVSSIANAFLDRTPLLYLCSSAPLAASETNMVQSGFDQAAVARPITKWAHRVTLPADIPRLVAQAIRIATAEPCGPVLLDIPSDVLFAPVDPLAAPIPKALRTEPPQPAAPAVDAALSLLASARRPVILVGDGAYMACAEAELREFVDATGIPVYSDYFAHGLLPASHPLYGGTFFKLLELDDPGARPDVVLALGTRFGVFTFGRGDRVIPFDARVIHVDVDAREIGRLRDADVSMVANAREVLRALNRERATKPWRDLAGWRARIEEKKVSRSRRFAETLLRSDPPIHPYQAVTTAVDTVGADAIFVGDGAHAHHWLAEAIRCEQPGGFVTHGLFADAGLGLGLAIGVQVARPEKRVVAVVGDGAVGFTIAEFDTMARHRLPIVVVVLNNRSWGATKHFQTMVSGPGRNIAVDLGDARYHDVAVAFGCLGAHVTHIEDLKPALEDALASGRPACINVEVELTAEEPPESAALNLAALH